MSQKFLGENKMLLLFTETETTLYSYCKSGVQFQWPLNNAVHVSGFCGEDGGIVEFNAVSLADTVFSYSQLVVMF
jgi:hypothetical protein